MDYTFGVIRDLHTDLSEFATSFGTYVDRCQTKTDDLKGVKEKVERYDNMSVEDYYVEAMIEALKDSAEYKDKKNAIRRGGMVTAERARLRREASFDRLSEAEQQRFISELETKRASSHTDLATVDVQKAELEVREVKSNLDQSIATLRTVNADTARSITDSITAIDKEISRVNERYAKLQAASPAAQFAALEARRKEETDKLASRKEFFVQARSLFDNLMAEIDTIELRNQNVQDNFAIQLDESLEAIKIITDGLDELNRANENSQTSVNEMTDSIKGLNDRLNGLNQDMFRVDIVTVGENQFKVVARFDGRKATSAVMTAEQLTKEAIEKHCNDFGQMVVGLRHLDEYHNAQFVVRKDGVILGDLNDQTKGVVGFDGYSELAVAAIAGLAAPAQTAQQQTPVKPPVGGEGTAGEQTGTATEEEKKDENEVIAPVVGGAEGEGGTEGEGATEEEVEEEKKDENQVTGPVGGTEGETEGEGAAEEEVEEEKKDENQVTGSAGGAEGATEGSEGASQEQDDDDLDLGTGVAQVNTGAQQQVQPQQIENNVYPYQKDSIQKTQDRLRVTNARLASRVTKLAGGVLASAALCGVAAVTSGPLLGIAGLAAAGYTAFQGVDATLDVVRNRVRRSAAKRKIQKVAKTAGYKVEYKENGEVRLYTEPHGTRTYLGEEDKELIHNMNVLLDKEFHNSRRGTGDKGDPLGKCTPVTALNLAAAFELCGGHGKEADQFAYTQKRREKLSTDAKGITSGIKRGFTSLGEKIGEIFDREDDEVIIEEEEPSQTNTNNAAAGASAAQTDSSQEDELDEEIDEELDEELDEEEELALGDNDEVSQDDLTALAAAAGVEVEQHVETPAQVEAQVETPVQTNEQRQIITASGAQVTGVSSDFVFDEDEEEMEMELAGVDKKVANRAALEAEQQLEAGGPSLS